MTEKTLRFTAALYIQEGACNPSGIALALHEACKECIRDKVDQRTDPAVRLIAHQLSYLLNVSEIDDKFAVYDKLTQECKTQSEKEVKVVEAV